MKKTATREDVENALNKHLLKDSVYNEILNELFGELYKPKVGEWVVIGEGNNGSINQTGEVGIVTNTYEINCTVDCGHNSNANYHNYEDIRPATEDEIKRAQWKEGEVYEVWYDGKASVLRLSSDYYGCFWDDLAKIHFYEWDNFKKFVQC
jgi:hypothetical protein